MKSVLIIEDDDFKGDIINEIIMDYSHNATVTKATSVSTAIDCIEKAIFDLIIIDMALPSHAVISGGGAPMSLLTGGLEIIFELHAMGRHDSCLIITQYPEIEISNVFYPVSKAKNAIEEIFSCFVLDCLQYVDNDNVWKEKFIHIIGKL